MAAARGPQDAAFGRPAPGWATQAVLAARRAAISRAGLQLSVRCDGAYVSLHAEAPIAEGDVIFREHPAVAAPSVLLEDEGGGAGLQTCEYCFAPVGSMAEQLQAVAAAAGLTLSAEQLEQLPPSLHQCSEKSAGVARCSGCTAVWCSELCQQKGSLSHSRMCAGALLQRGLLRAADAAAEYRWRAEESGNAAFMVAMRIYTSLPSDATGSGLGNISEIPGQASAGAANTTVDWDVLRGFCGAFWWDTLRPDVDIESEETGHACGTQDEMRAEAGGHGWGAAYGQAFRAEMISQTKQLASLLRGALLPEEEQEQAHEQEQEPEPEHEHEHQQTHKPTGVPANVRATVASAIPEPEPEPEVVPTPELQAAASKEWLTAEGLGWVVGLLRLNGQAMRVDSPLPEMILKLANCTDEDELDRVLAVLQPVMEARKAAMKEYSVARAEAGIEPNQDQEDDDGEEEDDDLPELEEIFPPKRAVGLFLLESAANHSCCPNAEILPLDDFTETVGATTSGSGSDTHGKYESVGLRCGAGIAMIATKDISVGEEITICYLGELTPPLGGHQRDSDESGGEDDSGHGGTSAGDGRMDTSTCSLSMDTAAACERRRSLLREQYLFECHCERCRVEGE